MNGDTVVIIFNNENKSVEANYKKEFQSTSAADVPIVFRPST